MRKAIPILLTITLFSIAMGFMETTVVIYLRAILYPEGFHFPLNPVPSTFLLTEILREAATMLMLAGAGALAGKTLSEKFAWFIYSFAIWDIFYYIFLKILINWPESLLTWDLLFLIPTTWTGPVLSPVIVSLTMILLSLVIIYFSRNSYNTRFDRLEWTLMIIGSLILIFNFTLDYSRFILEHYSLRDLWMLPEKELFISTAMSYVPRKFNWLIFISGELVLGVMILKYIRRLRKLSPG